jgi:hypothetical protein
MSSRITFTNALKSFPKFRSGRFRTI